MNPAPILLVQHGALGRTRPRARAAATPRRRTSSPTGPGSSTGCGRSPRPGRPRGARRRARRHPGADRRRPPPLRRLPAAAAPRTPAARTTAAWRCSSTRTRPRCSSAPIHRVLVGPSLADLRAAGGGDRRRPCAAAAEEQAVAALGPDTLVATDGDEWATLRLELGPDRAAVEVLHERAGARAAAAPRSGSATTTRVEDAHTHAAAQLRRGRADAGPGLRPGAPDRRRPTGCCPRRPPRSSRSPAWACSSARCATNEPARGDLDLDPRRRRRRRRGRTAAAAPRSPPPRRRPTSRPPSGAPARDQAAHSSASTPVVPRSAPSPAGRPPPGRSTRRRRWAAPAPAGGCETRPTSRTSLTAGPVAGVVPASCAPSHTTSADHARRQTADSARSRGRRPVDDRAARPSCARFPARADARAVAGNSSRATLDGWPCAKNVRRRPTLPQPLGCSTIGAERLNFRVRDGTGCFPFAMAAVTLAVTSTRCASLMGVPSSLFSSYANVLVGWELPSGRDA